MKKSILVTKQTAACIGAWLLIATPGLWASEKINYPPARVESVVETRFGTPLPDPYRWLENGKDPEVKAWVHAQDRLARGLLEKYPGREALARRFKELYEIEQISLPHKQGTRLFYTRRGAVQEKAAVYVRDSNGGSERLIIDPNRFSSQDNASLGDVYPSPDGRWLAYLYKPQNADEAVLNVRDVQSGKDSVVDKISGANYSDLSWTPDSRGFYYTRLPTDARTPEAERVAFADVRFHVVGKDSKEDIQVYPPTRDASAYLTPRVSRDGRWLFVLIQRGWTSNDIYVRRSPSAAFQPVFISTRAMASVTAWKDMFYLTTNEEAPNSKVWAVDAARLDREHWKLIVPERKEVVIESAQVLGERLVLRVLSNVSSRIEIRSLQGVLEKEIELPQAGSIEEIRGHEDDDTAYYAFESFFIPPRIYRLSLSTGKSVLWTETRVPIDPNPYQVEFVRFNSKDKTPVSMFIIRRKHIPKDNTTPVLMIGYGGFQEAMGPRFNAGLYPWLEAGGAVAVPHLRGGGEYGEAWHRAGILLNKQNTFDDMIAAAEYLIRKRYTQPPLLAMQGASNGGLLAGAMMVQRPDLFRAVICKNPLLDMIRYPLFGEGKAWIPEYGSPLQADEFRALSAYSPYHHLDANARYPAVLFLSAEYDDRVDPMHARKMAALLQAAARSKHPVLFRLLRQAGHSGADRTQSQVEEATDRMSFLFQEVGRPQLRLGAMLEGSAPGVGK